VIREVGRHNVLGNESDSDSGGGEPDRGFDLLGVYGRARREPGPCARDVDQLRQAVGIRKHDPTPVGYRLERDPRVACAPPQRVRSAADEDKLLPTQWLDGSVDPARPWAYGEIGNPALDVALEVVAVAVFAEADRGIWVGRVERPKGLREDPDCH
jgi:hypothetical protein